MKIKSLIGAVFIAVAFMCTISSTAEARSFFSFGFGGFSGYAPPPPPVYREYVVESYRPAYVERVYTPEYAAYPAYSYSEHVMPAQVYSRQVVVERRPVMRPAPRPCYSGFSMTFGR